jgi:prepilin-type N-terminal cleavage/methylation domain-containing protein
VTKFGFVELLVVVVIIGLVTGAGYVIELWRRR